MSAKAQSNHILEVKGLTKRYGKKPVVRGIDFHVNRGEVFSILGPNGAGKTTTLEMIETLRPIDGGMAVVDGLDVSKQPTEVKRIIGVQLQSAGFFDKLTLRELLLMFRSLYGSKTNVMGLLESVQLVEKSKSFIKDLSGGQRQRFSIAVALVHKPKVLFLDEPTTGLDPQARRNLWQLITKIKSGGITVVLTTHYMEEAELLSDRVAIMDEGKIVKQGTPEKLVQDLLDKGFKKEVVVKPASLEDVFIDLTGKELRD